MQSNQENRNQISTTQKTTAEIPFPFDIKSDIEIIQNELENEQNVKIDFKKMENHLKDLLRVKFSIYSPISFKIKKSLLKLNAIIIPFNDRMTYALEIIVDIEDKTIKLCYILCREHGQQMYIESKSQRLLIQRGLNKLNQTSDIGVYCINAKGGIRFKQHMFHESKTFENLLRDYTYTIKSENQFSEIRNIKNNNNFSNNNANNLNNYYNNINIAGAEKRQTRLLADTRLIKFFENNIDKHIQYLNINTAKILFLCDEIPREYFDVLERQGAIEQQKQFDLTENILKEVHEITSTDKIFVEEIADTSAFQTPAQQVENGLKTKIVQEIEILKMSNKESIGAGGFGDIYRAELKIKGVKSENSENQESIFQSQEKKIDGSNSQSQISNQLSDSSMNSNQNSTRNETADNGIVNQEEEKETHTKTYVLKENKSAEDNNGDRNRVQHEIEILMLLKDYECPYIAKYYYSRQPSYKQYLVIEFYKNKDLDSFRRSFSNTSSLISKIELMYQFSSGLKFLNDRGFYHLDIKPANILVSNKQQIKITDFGECYHHDVCEEKYRCEWEEHFKNANKNHLEKIDWKAKEIKDRQNQQQGKRIIFKPAKTMPYCPPESLSQKLQINYQSDIFSLGIMMCEIFFDEFPFKFKKSKYSIIEEKYKEKKWESFLPEEFVCKLKGPEKIIKILLRLALHCLNSSKLEKGEKDSYKLDRPCISQIIIVLKKCKEYLEQRYVNTFNKN